MKKASTKDCDILTQSQSGQLVYIPDVGPTPFSLFVDDVNDQMISRLIKLHRVWEPVETALVCKLISTGENVIDIGANIGYFTVLFSQLVGDKGRVYGFEPELKNYALLQSNILFNRLTNVTIENQAVSKSQGMADLHLSSVNKGDHRLEYTAGRNKQTIACTALDSYMANSSEPVHFIKSDTQGHELNVLKGMKKVIERNRGHLCCLFEFSPGLLEASEPGGLAALVDFFAAFDAQIYWLRERGENPELVLMSKAALLKLGSSMLEEKELDHACNILAFFSTKARLKYFGKMGW